MAIGRVVAFLLGAGLMYIGYQMATATTSCGFLVPVCAQSVTAPLVGLGIMALGVLLVIVGLWPRKRES